jgi:hypothetical protein
VCIWTSSKTSQAVTRIIPQVSDKSLHLARCKILRLFDHTPDVLDSPDNKVTRVVGGCTGVGKRRTHVLAISDAIIRACVRVLALPLVIHAWPHDTVPCHNSGKSKLHGDASYAAK